MSDKDPAQPTSFRSCLSIVGVFAVLIVLSAFFTETGPLSVLFSGIPTVETQHRKANFLREVKEEAVKKGLSCDDKLKASWNPNHTTLRVTLKSGLTAADLNTLQHIVAVVSQRLEVKAQLLVE